MGGNNLNFEVLIDESFATINIDAELTPVNNKTVLSLINDFEDGKWRYTKFQNFIWDNIVEAALSKMEREKLVNQDHSRLTIAAKNLRLTDKDDTGQGSELAEIVLYGVMKHHYGALSVVPKIFYKQNIQDNVKGADSVHIVINDNNDFSIWFGEAKFYNNIEDTSRLDTIIDSVEESLQIGKLRKENSIITNVSDIDLVIEDENTRKEIKALLKNEASMDDLKPKLHIPILLLHECPKTKAATRLTAKYKNEIITYHKNRAQSYFSKQISKIGKIDKYSDITFHLILFPVPNKKEIVDKFISNVEHYRNQ
jgi:hypothetical protein